MKLRPYVQVYKIIKKEENKMNVTPLKAIKKHCLECSGFEKKQVRECVIKDCVLFMYRQGTNPNRKGSTLSKKAASTKGFEKGKVSVAMGSLFMENER
ncbi:MAG: hypothetical protein COT22_14110 [Ignavibacteria bacterium CG08_land_8_20_14_0_20_37_9]|nr:MAG: hypothetical protein COT22_14110 [Ignavibacteria bacterium CG08_land_8_20_14_0_20_37_9]